MKNVEELWDCIYLQLQMREVKWKVLMKTEKGPSFSLHNFFSPLFSLNFFFRKNMCFPNTSLPKNWGGTKDLLSSPTTQIPSYQMDTTDSITAFSHLLQPPDFSHYVEIDPTGRYGRVLFSLFLSNYLPNSPSFLFSSFLFCLQYNEILGKGASKTVYEPI